MKRHGNLWDKIISFDNIQIAYDRAKKGKSKYSEVQKINSNSDYYLKKIEDMLKNKTFKNSKYVIKKIYEPKERDIFVLPFYPDRIIQHCLMNVIEPIWDNIFIHDSYACRKGKGQHKTSQRLMQFIRKSKCRFYFQGDVKKFYPSINHTILKRIVRNKIKDTHDYLTQENEGVTVYIQREFMPIPGNMIDRLGFTLNEVQGLIVS